MDTAATARRAVAILTDASAVSYLISATPLAAAVRPTATAVDTVFQRFVLILSIPKLSLGG